MTAHIHAAAGKATAEKGRVLLDGPGGVAITLTPDAAEEAGLALIRAAAQARVQDDGTAMTGEGDPHDR